MRPSTERIKAIRQLAKEVPFPAMNDLLAEIDTLKELFEGVRYSVLSQGWAGDLTTEKVCLQYCYMLACDALQLNADDGNSKDASHTSEQKENHHNSP